MPRISRADAPDSWHHVVNRAIARRTFFERRRDFRFFMAQLARAARRGEVEVHAYCLMGTHYHLLLRTPNGELGKAMQRVQLAYSRWFNRSRRRDGSLVRGRFFSKPVKSLVYRRALVRYIDANPIGARIIRLASDYPYGSAFHYAKSEGPRWLERSWVEGTVQADLGLRCYDPAAYSHVFSTMPSGFASIVEARLRHKSDQDPLENLVSASHTRVRSWMIYKARLADGTPPDLPTVSIARLQELVAAGRREAWTIQRGATERDAWPVVLAGLGRELCGSSLTLLSSCLGASYSTTSRLCRLHREEMLREAEYSVRAAALAHQALRDW